MRGGARGASPVNWTPPGGVAYLQAPPWRPFFWYDPTLPDPYSPARRHRVSRTSAAQQPRRPTTRAARAPCASCTPPQPRGARAPRDLPPAPPHPPTAHVRCPAHATCGAWGFCLGAHALPRCARRAAAPLAPRRAASCRAWAARGGWRTHIAAAGGAAAAHALVPAASVLRPTTRRSTALVLRAPHPPRRAARSARLGAAISHRGSARAAARGCPRPRPGAARSESECTTCRPAWFHAERPTPVVR
jgi:hypothetical protein